MSKYVEYVNSISAFFRDQAKEAKGPWQERFTALWQKSDEIHDELVKLYGLTSALPPDLGNIHDLPPELIEELSVSNADELEDQIVTVINSYGGEATLDQILVGLYRKFKITQKRRFMQNKLYRMTMVWSVDGRKGVYTTTEPDEPLENMPRTEEPFSTQQTPSSYDLDDEIPF